MYFPATLRQRTNRKRFRQPFVPQNNTGVYDLFSWIDFSDASRVTTTGQGISGYQDKASDLIWEQTTDANRPLYSNTINGLNVATFQGSDDHLLADQASSMPSDQSFTIFAVRKVSAANDFQTIIGQYRSTSPAERIWRLEANRAVVQSVKDSPSINNDEVTLRENYPFTTDLDITCMTWTPNVGLRIFQGENERDEVPVEFAFSQLPSATTEKLAIGSSSTSASPNGSFTGDICEILIYSGSELTFDQRRTNVYYLYNKWFV